MSFANDRRNANLDEGIESDPYTGESNFPPPYEEGLRHDKWHKYAPHIHPLTMEGIDNYVQNHQPVGSFLKAVFSNDLKEAFQRADDNNFVYFQEIMRYFWIEIPSSCWGSPEIYKNWVTQS